MLRSVIATTACARALRCPYGARGDSECVDAGSDGCCTLRVDARRVCNDIPSSLRRLGRGDYREQPKAGAAELSGVAQTDFLRMEECSQRR